MVLKMPDGGVRITSGKKLREAEGIERPPDR